MSEIITDIGFDSKSLWQPKGFEPHPFPETTWPLFKELNLKKLTEIEGDDLTPVQGWSNGLWPRDVSSFL